MEAPNERPVERGKYHEFRALWTTNMRQKLRKWNDGYLRFHRFNRKVLLYDEGYIYISDTFVKTLDVAVGEEINIDDRYLVTLEEDLGWKQMEIDSAADTARKQKRANLVKQGNNRVNKLHNQAGSVRLNSRTTPMDSQTTSSSVVPSTPAPGLNHIIQSSQPSLTGRKRRIGLTRAKTPSTRRSLGGSAEGSTERFVTNSKPSRSDRVSNHVKHTNPTGTPEVRRNRVDVLHDSPSKGSKDPEDLGFALSQTIESLSEHLEQADPLGAGISVDSIGIDDLICSDESRSSSPVIMSQSLQREVLAETSLNSSIPVTSPSKIGPWSTEVYDLFEYPAETGRNQ